MRYYNTFDEALNAKGFSERSTDQRLVFDAFRKGKHIILKAPTGWGKTFAVTSALKDGHAIYSLPLRVLVDSLSEDVQHTESGQAPFPKKIAVQHGARKEHTFLDKGNDTDQPIDLIFTTLDQSLSAFLGIPIGVSFRQGNILPAVVDASHLIFDEFHLLEPQRSMSTALYAIKQSQKNCIILTATLSSTMLQFLKEELLDSPVGRAFGVEMIIGERPFVNEKIIRKGSGLTNVEELALGEKTIIIRNRIAWAKETAQSLREIHPEADIHLLHSELLADHRHEIEEHIKSIFKKGAQLPNGKPQILIATQVVEAGIDISCDVMHTDLCPPSSFIQRLGRSARYAGESASIFWHDLSDEELQPYSYAKDDIAKLRNLLSINEAKNLDTEFEESIIEISSESDKAFTSYFRNRNPEQETLELRTLRDYEQYRERIRDIDSINVAIGSNPHRNLKFLSMNRGKLYGGKLPATFYQYNSEAKSYISLGTEDKMIPLADMALLNPELIGYAPHVGLDKSIEGGEQYFWAESDKSFVEYSYRLEPYEAHLLLLHKEKAKVRWIIDELAKQEYLGGTGYSATSESADLAEGLVDFVIWAHDIGKLTPKWQKAHNVTEAAGVPTPEKPLSYFTEDLKLDLLSSDYPIAHSETGGKYDRKEVAPSHAWVSAWAVKDLLWAMLDGSEKLFYPVFWAIAEHHGYLRNFTGDLSAKRFEPYELGYLDYLDRISERGVWAEYGWNSSLLIQKIDYQQIREIHTWFDSHPLMKDHAVSLYYALSYILRRCDQLATAHVSYSKTILNQTSEYNSSIL